MENTPFKDVVWFTCPSCGETYDRDYLDKIPKTCPVCGEEFVMKEDDATFEEDNSEMEGLTCPECKEWFQVITNTYGLGLNYCPCCGAEWKGEEGE